jgi:hypothetical protein
VSSDVRQKHPTQLICVATLPATQNERRAGARHWQQMSCAGIGPSGACCTGECAGLSATVASDDTAQSNSAKSTRRLNVPGQQHAPAKAWLTVRWVVERSRVRRRRLASSAAARAEAALSSMAFPLRSSSLRPTLCFRPLARAMQPAACGQCTVSFHCDCGVWRPVHCQFHCDCGVWRPVHC